MLTDSLKIKAPQKIHPSSAKYFIDVCFYGPFILVKNSVSKNVYFLYVEKCTLELKKYMYVTILCK
jgi:hypothetical protein